MTTADFKQGCLVVLENDDAGFVDETNHRIVFTYNYHWLRPEEFNIRVSDFSEFKDNDDKTISHGYWLKTEEDVKRINELYGTDAYQYKLGDFVCLSIVSEILQVNRYKYNGCGRMHIFTTWKQAKLDSIKAVVAHYLEDPYEVDTMKQKDLIAKYCEYTGHFVKDVTKFVRDESDERHMIDDK